MNFRSSSTLPIHPKIVQFFLGFEQFLTEYLGANKFLKSLSDEDGLHALMLLTLGNGYNHIFQAFTSIVRNTDLLGGTRNEAQSYAKKMTKPETILLMEIWNDFLRITNKTSTSLQNNRITMDDPTKLFASLADYISSARSNFDQ